jgi:hypothetical protein
MMSNCKCTGVQHAVGDGCDECVRTCLECGTPIYEYTDHEYCSPECAVESARGERDSAIMAAWWEAMEDLTEEELE